MSNQENTLVGINLKNQDLILSVEKVILYDENQHFYNSLNGNEIEFKPIKTSHVHSLRLGYKVGKVGVTLNDNFQQSYHDLVLAAEAVQDDGLIIVDGIESVDARDAIHQFANDFVQSIQYINDNYHSGITTVNIKYSEKWAATNVKSTFMDHDLPDKEYLAKTIKEGWTVLDVGGNHGEYAKVLSHLVKQTGKVIVFEPCKRDFNYLNDTLNKGNIVIENLALGNRNGQIDFYASTVQEHMGLNSLKPPLFNPWNSHFEKETVEIQTLEKYVTDNGVWKIDFVKVDIEGAELEFLIGAPYILNHARPPIMIEVSDYRTVDHGYAAVEIMWMLEKYNYVCHTIESGGTLKPVKYTDYCHLCMNIVAVPAERLEK